jgi:hypothetical protein
MILRKQKAARASAAKNLHSESRLDEALRETFPASDPIAITIEESSPKVIRASKVVGAHLIIREPVMRGPRMTETDEAKVGAEERSLAAPLNPMLWGPIQLFNWWSLLIWGGPTNSPPKGSAAN